MAEEPENLVLRQLRELRAEMLEWRAEMRAGFNELRALASDQKDELNIASGLAQRLDAIEPAGQD